MTGPSQHEITQLLRAWSQGEKAAPEQLMPLVYDELHRLASRQMSRERPDHTLQTTALVHEAYLKLIDASVVDWNDRTHFFALSAKVMRRVLVDWPGRIARSREAASSSLFNWTRRWWYLQIPGRILWGSTTH